MSKKTTNYTNHPSAKQRAAYQRQVRAVTKARGTVIPFIKKQAPYGGARVLPKHPLIPIFSSPMVQVGSSVPVKLKSYDRRSIKINTLTVKKKYKVQVFINFNAIKNSTSYETTRPFFSICMTKDEFCKHFLELHGLLTFRKLLSDKQISTPAGITIREMKQELHMKLTWAQFEPVLQLESNQVVIYHAEALGLARKDLCEWFNIMGKYERYLVRQQKKEMAKNAQKEKS